LQIIQTAKVEGLTMAYRKKGPLNLFDFCSNYSRISHRFCNTLTYS